jgi:CO/xanthine dehydrogenase FAD-binding subunit
MRVPGARARWPMYFQARTIAEALQILAAGESAILSGGTDFYPALVDRSAPQRILDISAVSGLSGIETAGTEIRIGAATRWRDIAEASLLPCLGALQDAAREIGSIQIQNAGTVGGNLCNASPAADGVPPLLILDAEVEIASLDGKRREPLSAFIQGNRRTSLAPGELLTQIIIPRVIDRGHSRFLKLGARRYLVISIAMAAACIATSEDGCVSDARVAVGACSAVALRLPQLEKALLSKPARRGLGGIAQAGHLAALSPVGDVRATAAYRLDAALQLVRNAIEACVAGGRHG